MFKPISKEDCERLGSLTNEGRECNIGNERFVVVPNKEDVLIKTIQMADRKLSFGMSAIGLFVLIFLLTIMLLYANVSTYANIYYSDIISIDPGELSWFNFMFGGENNLYYYALYFWYPGIWWMTAILLSILIGLLTLILAYYIYVANE